MNKMEAVAMIKRNGGSVSRTQIYHPLPGIKVLGAIDYLVKKHNFDWVRKK